MRQRQADLDRAMMFECLALAERGAGHVSPNPMVGAVLTKGGKVIGRGFHRRFGGDHAEIHALASSTSSPRGATLYVNLEPCNYFGKTPPCTDRILSSGIRRVVVGMKDPNPRVSGRGIAQLRRAGVEVELGVAGAECARLNEAFTKYIRTGLPWVAMKVAQTLDGKISLKAGRRSAITNAASARFVHELRARSDAVVVGAGTVKADNPLLTVRAVRGRSPIRVVLDGNLRVDPKAKLFGPSPARTIVVTSEIASRSRRSRREALLKKGVEVVALPSTRAGRVPVDDLLGYLGSVGVASLLVEGGAETFSAFLEAGSVDKLYVLVAPRVYGSGLSGFAGPAAIYRKLNFSSVSWWSLEGDACLEAYLI